MASLPGDPQSDLFVKLHPDNVKGSMDNVYLRMNLLDFICMYILQCYKGHKLLSWWHCHQTIVGVHGNAYQRTQETREIQKVVQAIGGI